ncbi:MAG: hypothetical protein K8T90_14685 [Planctomycetes bacterium]|nr:hypothetical protein [Planctomycetota bacterium]
MTKDGRGLVLAIAAAFAASMLAIAEHAEQVEQGYRLAAARCEGEVLTREAQRAERKVALMRLPFSVSGRATAMKLELEHPRDRRTFTEDQVAAILGPARASAELSNASLDTSPNASPNTSLNTLPTARAAKSNVAPKAAEVMAK